MLNNPRAIELSDHKPNFRGPTFRVEKEENSVQVSRTDLEDDPVVAEVSGTDQDALREARTQAQVMAKRESSSNQAAKVRVPSRSETLGFGGMFEERKRTPTPEEDLEELEDVALRDEEPVSRCISKEMESGMEQDQAVAICLSKRDRGELQDTGLELSDQDASEPNADINVNEDVEETLQELVEEHNSEVDKESREATLGQLKSVYSRGRGAFTQTSRPGVDSATQWALARVKNAYLPLLKTGEPPNEDYVQDNDLLPPGHPKSTRGEMSDQQAGLDSFQEAEEESQDEWVRDKFDQEGDEGTRGPNSEVLLAYDHPQKGRIRIEKHKTIKSDPTYYLAITNPPNFFQNRQYDSFRPAERRAEKYIQGELRDKQTELPMNQEEDSEEPELIDRTETSSEDDSEKADFTKKAETLKPYEDEQENLRISDVDDQEISRRIELTEARQVFEEYQRRTELTVDDLETWISGDCHERASGDDSEKHIRRAMFLLEEIDTAEESVTEKVPEELAMERASRRIPDELEGEVSGRLAVFQMEYATSFIQRHEAMVDDISEVDSDTEDCPTISETALRNWAGSHYSNPEI